MIMSLRMQHAGKEKRYLEFVGMDEMIMLKLILN
jgi:hypothetical protein